MSAANQAVRHQSFAALRHPGYRMFFIGTTTAMLADNIEHVISYWVIFHKFQSPTLGGFAVVSHWLPFLLLSAPIGALSDRLDPRRIIQCGMLLFLSVSVAWGLLFLTDSLQMWHAMALLTLHGLAGVLWHPASQVLLYGIVGPAQLQSAVRLAATGRYCGMLAGPAVGNALLLALGPAHGIFVSALIYLPMLLWLWKAPYGPRFRDHAPPPSLAIRGFSDIFKTIGLIGANRVVLAMTLLATATSMFIGNSYQAQMPEFAVDLRHGDPGVTYAMLFAADAAGALVAGIVLESRGLLRSETRTAFVLAMLWATALGAFALVDVYPIALALLFAAGFLELSFNSMAQTLVQLNAPAAARGRVIGVFLMGSMGMRAFAGISVGIVGGLIGIHGSLALSALAVVLVVGSLAMFGKAR